MLPTLAVQRRTGGGRLSRKPRKKGRECAGTFWVPALSGSQASHRSVHAVPRYYVYKSLSLSLSLYLSIYLSLYIYIYIYTHIYIYIYIYIYIHTCTYIYIYKHKRAWRLRTGLCMWSRGAVHFSWNLWGIIINIVIVLVCSCTARPRFRAHELGVSLQNARSRRMCYTPEDITYICNSNSNSNNIVNNNDINTGILNIVS